MSSAIREALWSRLSTGTALTALLAPPANGYTQGIYHEQAPDDARFPFVVFSRSSGRPVEAFTAPSAYEEDMWLVKAIDRSPSGNTAEAIAAAVQSRLNDAPLTIPGGGSLLYLRRQSDVEYVEVSNGSLYRHCGAMYRLVATL
jgi:hypothetical protein